MSETGIDHVARADAALSAAEEALRELDGEFEPSATNITATSASIGGRLVRVVSIISEKNARES